MSTCVDIRQGSIYRKIPPPPASWRGEVSIDVIWGKNMKRGREKGRKCKRNRKKGKEMRKCKKGKNK
jgi:hypothetical protein